MIESNMLDKVIADSAARLSFDCTVEHKVIPA
jgi:hypothetical protein